MIRILLGCLLITSVKVQAQKVDFTQVDFGRADSLAALYKGTGLEKLPELAYKLTAPLSTEVEKFRAIYIWVCTNLENDYWYYLKNKKKREKLQGDAQALTEWNQSFQSQVFKKLLKEQKTICTGYAYLVRELSSLANINCKIIDGYGRAVNANIGAPGVPNHSWNAVQLHGRWYLCDATWSSGVFDLRENRFIPNYHDGYFLAAPDLFIKSHYPLDTTWILMADKPELKEFLNAPLVYRYAFDYHIIPLEPQLMNLQVYQNEPVTFLCKAPDTLALQNINLELVSGSHSRTVNPEISRDQEGLLAISYPFQRQGEYDVHIKVKEYYVITYTVKVKRNKP